MHRILLPPVVMLITGLFMWLTSHYLAPEPPTFPGRAFLAAGIFALGLGLMIASARHFGRAGTTINPARPEESEVLIREGIYRYTRNPIYLGDLLMLVGWGVYLGNPVNLAWLVGFVWFMTGFQIRREEKALEEKFGDAYRRYRQEARRWI